MGINQIISINNITLWDVSPETATQKKIVYGFIILEFQWGGKLRWERRWREEKEIVRVRKKWQINQN